MKGGVVNYPKRIINPSFYRGVYPLKRFAEDEETVVAIPVVLEVVAVQVALVAIPIEVRDVTVAAGVREGNAIYCAKRHPNHRPSPSTILGSGLNFIRGRKPTSISHQVSSIFWNVSAHTAVRITERHSGVVETIQISAARSLNRGLIRLLSAESILDIQILTKYPSVNQVQSVQVSKCIKLKKTCGRRGTGYNRSSRTRGRRRPGRA